MPRMDITLAPSEVAAVGEPKHTPGPWHVGAQNDALYIIDKPARPSGNDYPNHDIEVEVIAKVYDGPSAEANANIFAASLDLLAAVKTRSALEGMEDPFRHGCDRGCRACERRVAMMEERAIRKAESR